MIKVWKFVSIVVVLAVCLGLTLVPTALPGGMVSASNNVTISVQPDTTHVGFGEAFNLTVEVDNPSGVNISTVAARLDFNTTYFNVTGITHGPTLTTHLLSQYDNVAGTIDYDAGILGGDTTLNTILVCTISCMSKGAAGSSTVDFVYISGPPPRQTAVQFGPTDYLESGNMSLMYSGTVIVTGMPVLTVDVVGSGNVTINGTLPPSYPNTTSWTWGAVVELEAFPAGGWMFNNWIGNLTGSTNPDTITMNGTKNVTADFVELPPELDVDPDSLSLTVAPNATGTRSYTVTNIGGGTLNWNSSNVTYDPNGNMTWLTQNVTSGSLTHNMFDTVLVTVNTTGLESGTYNATINITGGATNALVNVTLTVGVPGLPEIAFRPESFTFFVAEGEQPADQTLEIWNAGTGTLDWSVRDGVAWLVESPTSGSSTGEHDSVTLSIRATLVAVVGDYHADITISASEADNSPQSVPVTLRVVAKPVGPASISASGLSITPQQVQSGREVTISVSVANTGGETGSYNAVLYINGAVEDSQSVSVPGGTSKNVIFTVSKTKAGVYDVSLAGQNGQFEVVGGGGWFAGGLGTGGIIAIVVVVIVLIVAVIFILRGTARPE